MLEVRRQKQTDKWMRTQEIVELLSESEVRIPGMEEHDVFTDDIVRKRVLQAVGRKLAICFRAGDEVEIDGHISRRRKWLDPHTSIRSNEYWFSEDGEVPF